MLNIRHVIAIVIVLSTVPAGAAQQRNPLQEAKDLLNSSGSYSSTGLRAGYLAEIAIKPKEPEKKLCYICWYGDFATYGGATREEAIAGAKKAKEMNPSTSIRLTEHLASPSMTVDAISKTPGKVILDLR